MSSAGPQLAPSAQQPESPRSPLAHLLHALNQPLTGLQCSMELALAATRPVDAYVRTLSEGLELLSRMRLLVAALRELADLQAAPADERVVILLDHLLREAGRELRPVAESANVRLVIANAGPLPVRAQAGPLTSLVFRTIEAVVSLCRDGSEVRIDSTAIQNAASIALSWKPGPPEDSPFSRAELGLLLAQAGWEHLGATCTQSREGDTQNWGIRIPLAWSTPCAASGHIGKVQGERR